MQQCKYNLYVINVDVNKIYIHVNVCTSLDVKSFILKYQSVLYLCILFID